MLPRRCPQVRRARAQSGRLICGSCGTCAPVNERQAQGDQGQGQGKGRSQGASMRRTGPGVGVQDMGRLPKKQLWSNCCAADTGGL